MEFHGHCSTLTGPGPISKSAAQRANRQTADGQTDRAGKEDRGRRSDRAAERGLMEGRTPRVTGERCLIQIEKDDRNQEREREREGWKIFLPVNYNNIGAVWLSII